MEKELARRRAQVASHVVGSDGHKESVDKLANELRVLHKWLAGTKLNA